MTEDDGIGAADDLPGEQHESGVDRRTFLKRGLVGAAGIAGAGGAIAALSSAGSADDADKPAGMRAAAVRQLGQRQPNILVIMLDQMRTPVWPNTVPLDGAMPNLDRIRRGGVSFVNHFTAANDCTPSRSTLLTGLYTHQTGCMITGGSTLDPGFPTWGSMLREQGYETYWYGKWHLTHGDNMWRPGPGRLALERYGFAGGTYPSPDGGPGQGWHKDPNTVAQFERWVTSHAHDTPWCTTVSFVNPHDIAWWYGWSQRVPAEAQPPAVSQALAPNYETPEQMIARNKPALQRSLQDTAAASFGPVPFYGGEAREVWLPFMDLYVRLLKAVDDQIGRVLDALEREPEVAANTVIVFTSDHGEYGSSHGMRGKGASAYEEAIRVPLIVKDPRAELTAAPAVERSQLTSSVDVAPLLLTIASGSDEWREQERYEHLARRADLAAILADPGAPGRPYVLHATDEVVTEFAVEPYAADAPLHVVGLRTSVAKIATYSNWSPTTITIQTSGQERELYDYSTHNGRLEIENVAGEGALYSSMSTLLEEAITHELRRPLPADLQPAHGNGFADYFLLAQRAVLGSTAARLRRRNRAPLPAPTLRHF